MDIVLVVLRVLIAVALYAFLGVILWVLLREGRTALAAHQSATLARLDGNGAPAPGARAYTLTAQVPAWVGRDPNCAICVKSDFASLRHACFEWRADKQTWWIEDNASRNGTEVNGEKVMRCELASGDIITIGGTQFKFTIDG